MSAEPGPRPLSLLLDLPEQEDPWRTLRDALANDPHIVLAASANQADLRLALAPGQGEWLAATPHGPGDGRREDTSLLRADIAPDDLVHALRLVVAGYRITPRPAGAHGAASEGPSDIENTPRPQLTPRELAVLALLADGASNKLIARQLGISASTTKFHVASVLHKLGARSRLDAVSLGVRHGLVLI